MHGLLEAYADFEQTGVDYHDVVRMALHPAHQYLTDAEVDGIVAQTLAQMTPEEMESFWDTLSGVGRKIASTAAKVAPTVLPIAGAAIGTYFGGPMGTQIGAQLGQMGGQLLAGKKPSAPGPQAQGPVAAAASALGAGGGSPVNQLLGLVQNPAFLQSLLGQALGPAGRQSVPVGPRGTEIPFGAFMNTLSSLANTAAGQTRPSGENVEAYLLDDSGNFVCDPANPDARAQQVLRLLRESYASTAASTSYLDPVTEWFGKAGLME